jgi:predicted phage-related endonuclease
VKPYVRVPVTSDTPAWEAARRGSVGASEVAAIMGLSPYNATPRTVYLSKKGIESQFPRDLGFIGHELEPVIKKWVELYGPDDYPDYAEDMRGLKRGFMARSRSHSFIHASFDYVSGRADSFVTWQFKTAGAFVGHQWAEGVPLAIQVQVQGEMFVAGTPYAYVVVLIGGREFKVFRVDRDQEWIDGYMIPALTDFWQHVTDNVEPEPISIAEVAKVYPSRADNPIEAGPAALAAYDRRLELLEELRFAKEQLEPLELALATYMQDHDVLTRDGVPILSYKSQRGAAPLDRALLRDEWPAAYAAALKDPPEYKVFRIIKPKEKK